MEELIKEFSTDSKIMQEKFQYKYNSSQCILYKYYYGSITLKDVISSWIHAIENNLIPKETKGFVLDTRNTNFKMEINEYEGIAVFYDKYIRTFKNRKIAIISNEPRAVAMAIMVEKKDDRYYTKPFCTIDAATAWILGCRK